MSEQKLLPRRYVHFVKTEKGCEIWFRGDEEPVIRKYNKPTGQKTGLFFPTYFNGETTTPINQTDKPGSQDVATEEYD